MTNPSDTDPTLATKTFAVIEDGVVVNCIVGYTKEVVEELTGKTCVEYQIVEPGWLYSEGIFSKPI
jgi:hypothetical protein